MLNSAIFYPERYGIENSLLTTSMIPDVKRDLDGTKIKKGGYYAKAKCLYSVAIIVFITQGRRRKNEDISNGWMWLPRLPCL